MIYKISEKNRNQIFFGFSQIKVRILDNSTEIIELIGFKLQTGISC